MADPIRYTPVVKSYSWAEGDPDDYYAVMRIDPSGAFVRFDADPWLPIEELEDPKEGSVCLGWFRDGAPRLVTRHLGKWLLYTGGGDARGLTHVHRMGPIRGPGEG